jgi:hypothetical protein
MAFETGGICDEDKSCDVGVRKLFSSSLSFWERAFIQFSLNFLERRLESPE